MEIDDKVNLVRLLRKFQILGAKKTLERSVETYMSFSVFCSNDADGALSAV